MLKIFCDMCGKNISPAISKYSMHIYGPKKDGDVQIQAFKDLCEDCYKNLMERMGQKTKKD